MRFLPSLKNTMHQRHSGSSFIEIIFATTLISVGLLVVFYSIIESREANLHNNLASTALNVMQSQVDKDSALDYAALSSSSPALDPVLGLPEGAITREVTENVTTQTKSVRYVLSWKHNTPQRIQTEYVLINNGLVND